MYPVGIEVIEEKGDRTQPPGERIRPKNDADTVNEMHGDGDIENTDQAPAGEHDKHGNARFARAAADARDTMGKRQ